MIKGMFSRVEQCTLAVTKFRKYSVMSGLITGPYFKQYFNEPTAFEIGAMVSILEVGAFGMGILAGGMSCLYLWSTPVTSIAAGRVGDVIGRKMTLFWGAVLFSVGGAIQTFTNGYHLMLLGRVISGFGVGLLS